VKLRELKDIYRFLFENNIWSYRAVGSAEHLSSTAVDPVFAGARSLGMSGAGVMLTGHATGAGNPAGLAVLSDLTLGLQYANYFMVPELGQGAFSVGLPAITGAFGLDYTSLGNAYYRENQVCLSFGKTLGDKLRAGISLHYLMVRQPAGFENLSAISPSLGLQVMPVEGLTIGFRVFNPTAQNYQPEGYLRLPVIIQAGLVTSSVRKCWSVLRLKKKIMKR